MNGTASLMTLLERDAWLHPDPGAIDVTHGYPEGLTPERVRELRLHPPAGFPDAPPGELADAICDWFWLHLFWGPGMSRYRRCGMSLALTCSEAFAIAVTALMRAPGDEFILLDTSFDCWPRLLADHWAAVRYARRREDGLPDAGSIAAACTDRTRAVVIVSPDNPLGVITPAPVMRQIAALCAQRELALIADHSLAQVNPSRAQIPVISHLAAGTAPEWIALGDTGKILGLGGSKLGVLAYPDSLQEAVAAAASHYFFQLPRDHLSLIASTLSGGRFSPLGLSDQIGANGRRLREEARPPLKVTLPGAGPFALIDAAGLGLDDMTLASLLRDRYRVLAVPVSWFPSGQPGRETRVRVSLARDPGTITRLIEALNTCAADLAP